MSNSSRDASPDREFSVDIPDREPDLPLTTTIVHGPGVLADGPVIQTTVPPVPRRPASPRHRFLESAVLFVCAIVFLRALAVEPFGVPTGSMAPTVIGNHKALACDRCGYPVKVGEPANRAHGFPSSFCPNCGKADLNWSAAPEIAGDRLLVDKNVFRLRSPRRWELAVFICPSDKSKPYVKRVVGLPGEEVQLQDGDVWIDGRLCRKTLAEARACRVPVFDSHFAPPGGWHFRWLADGVVPLIGPGEPPEKPAWLKISGNEVSIEAATAVAPHVVTYWHVSPDSLAPELIHDGLEYNGHTAAAHNYAVHDFFLDMDIEIRAGTGAVLFKMTDGADEVTAYLAAGGEFGESKLLTSPKALLKTANSAPLKLGKTYHVEMAFVDRRIAVAVDGNEYFSHDFPPSVQRADLTAPFKIGGQGVDVAFKNVRLWRDIYYRSVGTHATQTPLRLGDDQYFLLGDNSANSDDGRTWQIPAVPERNFLGKPFLLHQPSRPAEWAVGGRRLDVQAIDWGRIRWLR